MTRCCPAGRDGEFNDDLVNQFQLITTNLLDEFAPVRLITVRERVHKPWFVVDLRDTRRKVRLLEQRFKTDKAPAWRDAWRSALREARKKNHMKAAEYCLFLCLQYSYEKAIFVGDLSD